MIWWDWNWCVWYE